MKNLMLVSLVGVVALASCGTSLSGKTKSHNFAAQTQTGYDGKQAGTAKVSDLNDGNRVTVLTASGLKANTAYVAHYHASGANVANGVCASNGAIVGDQGAMTMIGGQTFTSDANGALTIRGLNTTATLTNSKASYINIHEAAALAVVPLCADLTK